ncbi:hypothetical protein GMOD_00009508 [Pyrenophora seminiperda CCB06]|uniref:Uncharacterized protein n=1 Tax=Pyrenophora seminiperda CCB06 TaxID=1302712 RepID=A0A3M7MGY9_9PLEO|nr:hypothetical protein GMOD_00009508 [Pyrenophora seminiperda CCB06]
MSLHLRISSSQERRPAFRGKTRQLLRLSDVPDSPASSGAFCDAVESDGHDYAMEQNTREAEKLMVTSLDAAKRKIMKLRQSVDLRRQIQDRFYPRGGDIQDYTKWIHKMENDVRALADALLMSNLNRGLTPKTPGIHTTSPHPDKFNQGEKIIILRSPLDPRIPIDSLGGLPDDGTILVLKHFYLDLCADGIRRLYDIVPDPDDSRNRPISPGTSEQIGPDTGTDIIRAWFRIMVLNDSEAATLKHATKSKSIYEFLMGCQASQLGMYCDFFKKAWRPYAVQPQNDETMLGYSLPLVSYTTHSWTLASICSNFEDYITICKLLMMELYSEHWYDPKSILGECLTGVYMGFIPTSKGDFLSHTGLKQENNVWVQRQSRNYLCGQMAIDELRKRTASLYLVVYEGIYADATVHPTEPDLFISRYRSAIISDELDNVDFTTTLTLEDIKNQLRMRKTLMYDPIVVDSWQFIIIDREVGLPFRLIDIVQDTLLMLVGDPSPRQMSKRVIREIIPSSVQEICLEEIQIECTAELRYPPPGEIQHEGNRWRCFNPEPAVLAAKQTRMTAQHVGGDDNRFIRRVIEDMERYGIVSLAHEYEEPQTHPIIVQGADGAPDLYFPYVDSATRAEGERAPTLPLPQRTCLTEFAQAYKQKHPNAIMAKGSIQTHYCAWPMPTMRSLGKSGLNFATWEGHIYRWNAIPFDRPSSANAWQYYIQHFLNSKYPFVMFYLTTFVICAADQQDSERKMTTILEEMEDRGWRITLPKMHEWTSDVEKLRLDKLFNGISPA